MRRAYLACECLLEALAPSKYANLKVVMKENHFASIRPATLQVMTSCSVLVAITVVTSRIVLRSGLFVVVWFLPLISVDHSLNWCLILCTLKPNKQHEAVVLLKSSQGSQSAITIISHLILLSVAVLFNAVSCLHHRGFHPCTPNRKQDDDADDVVRRLSKLNTAGAFPRSRIPFPPGLPVRPGEVAPGSIVLFLCSMDLL